MPNEQMRLAYRDYLNSGHWRSKRAEYAAARPWRCDTCGATKDLHLHHITYKRVGAELLGDLIPLCEEHHRAVHMLVKQGVKLRDAHIQVRTGDIKIPLSKMEKRRLKRERRAKLKQRQTQGKKKQKEHGARSVKRTARSKVMRSCPMCGTEQSPTFLRCRCGHVFRGKTGIHSEHRLLKK